MEEKFEAKNPAAPATTAPSGAPSRPMIEITDLHKHFGEKKVLNGVSLTINDGEVVSIIGGSGTGKSTFIKCVVRLIKPDGGKIVVDGRDITFIQDEFELDGIRKKFGYLFQEGALFDSMNKMAVLEGITVLNINDLSTALKPVVLPGEGMPLFIMKEGKEKEQGVGYLDDGTMVRKNFSWLFPRRGFLENIVLLSAIQQSSQSPH